MEIEFKLNEEKFVVQVQSTDMYICSVDESVSTEESVYRGISKYNIHYVVQTKRQLLNKIKKMCGYKCAEYNENKFKELFKNI